MSPDRTLTEPRTSRRLRRRILRHYLPLAIASGVVPLLFMTFPHSGTFPKGFPAGQSGQHGGAQAGPSQQGPGHQIPPELLEQIPREHRGQIPGLTPSSREVDGRSFERRLTTASGYLALGLLAVALLIGPTNLLLRRRNPISSYLRRDIGAWTAFFSGVHLIVSLTVHGSGEIHDFLDFFVVDGKPLTNRFGWGTPVVHETIGLLQTLVDFTD